MSSIITPEEKVYLKKISNYLRSYGMSVGEIEFELDDDSYVIELSRGALDSTNLFQNNYTVEIPFGVKPIIKKIVDYVNSKELFGDTADIYPYGQSFTIYIDTKKKQIGLTHNWNYYDEDDEAMKEWDGKEASQLFDQWEQEDELSHLDHPDDKILTAKYSGNGDSGYLEETFTDGNEIPGPILDWAYERLEDFYPGWEINEGSFGRFVFDFNKKVIYLFHTDRVYRDASDTLWEESFGEG
jgi:hypothetical protein